MQLCRQFEYFWVSEADPSPWSHFAAHLLVSVTMLELGAGTPTQIAWHETSPDSQLSKHFCSADLVADGCGAEVVPEAAETIAAKPTAERIAAENFIAKDGL